MSWSALRALARSGALVCGSLFLAWSMPVAPAHAGLVVTSSDGSISYQRYTDTTNSAAGSAPSFFENLGLQSPGAGYPILTSPALIQAKESSLFQNGTPSVSLPMSLRVSNVPNFGTASTNVSAFGSSLGASFRNAGTYWDTTNFVQDNFTTPGLAAVTVTASSCTFFNDSFTTSLSATPILLMNVTGTLGTAADSFIAASLAGSITVGGTTQDFAPTVIATDGNALGSRPDLALGGNRRSVTVSGLNVTGSAASYLPTVVIGPRQSFTIFATLTLISDPGSSITISSLLPGDIEGDLEGFGSTIGAYAGGPLTPAAIPVPEPATFFQAGFLLVIASTAAARRIVRSRRSS